MTTLILAADCGSDFNWPFVVIILGLMAAMVAALWVMSR